MAISRQVLPTPVLEAIEECVKAAKQHGVILGQGKDGSQEFQALQVKRRALVTAIENHAKSMFEGGCEIGREQAEGAR